MASSSTTWQWKYSVFLSFSGEDVRNNFVSFLYEALSKISSDVFIDYRLKPAEEIAPALEKAIEGSRIAVVIFSKNYASSTWCLDELEKIIQWNESHGQLVIPVFYNVDSSDVHDPTAGIYAEAFARHEWKLKGNFVKRLRTTISKTSGLAFSLLWRGQEGHSEGYEEGLDQVQRWKIAMFKAARFKGWDSSVTRPDASLVNAIVKHVSTILIKESPNNIEGLVGIDSSIQQIKDILTLESDDVRFLCIFGMGGVGKTTIAKVLFKQILSEFDASCILLNVRQEVKMSGGISYLKGKLYSGVLGEEIIVHNIEYTRFFQKRKVLLVLDDLTDLEQLIFLIGDKFWLGSGSRIIVTCREKKVFEREGILGDEVVVMKPYELRALNYTDSLNLFCQNAFMDITNSTDEFWSLSNLFVEYAAGVPLALVILGRHLQCSRNKNDWENALTNLKNGPRQEIQDVLKLSFDALSDDGKKMFLDVACFFNGEDFAIVQHIFKVSKYSEDINYLINKCLVGKSTYNNIVMHPLLQEMGRKIESESYKRKRIWHHEDAVKVFRRKQVWKSIESISLDMSQIKELKLAADVFVQTPNLKHLRFYYSNMDDELNRNFKVQLPQGLECFPDELVYLYWSGYPLKSFPPNFDTTMLVALHLPHSELCWEENKELETTDPLDFSSSSIAFRLGNKTFQSIAKFENLVELNLRGCKNIRRIPSITGLKFIEVLELGGCPLVEFPDVPRNITQLCLDGTLLKEVPSSICSLDKLEVLWFSSCQNLREVPLNILFCKSLRLLNLGDGNVKSFRNLENTDDFSNDREYISSYELLKLSNTGFESLPSCIGQFNSLRFLFLDGCRYLRSLPELPPSIIMLQATDCCALENISSLKKHFDLSPNSNPSVFQFENCLKVNEISWRKLQPSMFQRIRDIAMNKRYFPPPISRHVFEICYPGTSIPESFACSDNRTSITINLLPNWRNSSFLGFVLCALLDPTACYRIDCKCCFLKGNGDRMDMECWPLISEGNFFADIILNSQHVVLWYDCYLNAQIALKQEWFTDDCNKVSFEFSGSKSKFPGESEMIRKCGVYLLYDERMNSMDISTRQRLSRILISELFYQAQKSGREMWAETGLMDVLKRYLCYTMHMTLFCCPLNMEIRSARGVFMPQIFINNYY